MKAVKHFFISFCLVALVFIAPCSMRIALQHLTGTEITHVTNKVKATKSIEKCSSTLEFQKSVSSPKLVQVSTIPSLKIELLSHSTHAEIVSNFAFKANEYFSASVPLYMLLYRWRIHLL